LRATSLGHGAYRIDGAPSGYHTGFVVGTNAVAIFDAPISPAEAQRVRAVIERTAPGRRITHVVASHTHRDHIAGLRMLSKMCLKRGNSSELRHSCDQPSTARASSTVVMTHALEPRLSAQAKRI
jgi:glyoxylase-like metal-dependent hydrolase (beta-lactamase superfamily II)